MGTYAVVLIIDTDAADTDPGGWDWPSMLDTPHGVACLQSVELDGDPSPDTAAAVVDTVRDLADSLRRVAPVRA